MSCINALRVVINGSLQNGGQLVFSDRGRSYVGSEAKQGVTKITPWHKRSRTVKALT